MKKDLQEKRLSKLFYELVEIGKEKKIIEKKYNKKLKQINDLQYKLNNF